MVMAASTAPTNTKKYLSRHEQGCCKNAYRMKKEDKIKGKENPPGATPPVRASIYDVIYDIVRAVPKGRVTSYGAVAAAIGVTSGARMVGYAMNHCEGAKPKVPAHRVLNRNGMLTGKHHFSPPEKMQQLLEKEGIKVKEDKVVNFDSLFWDPMKELEV